MERYFNTEGACFPQEHYMVDLTSRLAEIRKYVDRGKYFAINRGRQYGKTTTLKALEKYLNDEYIVAMLDFQHFDIEDYGNSRTFVIAFAQELQNLSCDKYEITDDLKRSLDQMAMGEQAYTRMRSLFRWFGTWCKNASKPIVLIIDEVDTASNNQVFLDFLAQLRADYLDRNGNSTFQSVILAGVHDIRNLRQKIRPDSEHKHNSPWNIAADFEVSMGFSVDDISSMLKSYENDHNTGMDILEMSEMLYEYTSGYPVLVSGLCKIIDEKINKWSKDGLLEAVKILLLKKMPLFESLINKLEDDEKLRNLLYALLFNGQRIQYNSYDSVITLAEMFGFVKNVDNAVVVSNRIFETLLYDWFMSIERTNSLSLIGADEKPQFVKGGKLNMELVFEKFVQHFNDIYGDNSDTFKEEDGRKFFLLYLRPIINGTGNYYIEAETRNRRRTDVIVDYAGEQFIIELKIWHGERYNADGEQQISDYLDYYHLNKGYMVSFNFNKNKQSGVETVEVGGKMLVEAIV